MKGIVAAAQIMKKPANDNFSTRLQRALALMTIVMDYAAIAAGEGKGQGTTDEAS